MSELTEMVRRLRHDREPEYSFNEIEIRKKIEQLEAQLANITALCSQEGNDGEPWDTIYALAERKRDE